MPKRESAGFPPAVSLLYGKRKKEESFDEYLAEKHLERIKAALAGDTAPAASDFEAAEADLADVLDEVSTPPLWGKSRLIILRDAEEILSPAADERERLAPFVARMTAVASMKDPPGRLVLIARALEIKEGRPRSGFAEANGLIAAIEKAGGLFPCVPPYEREVKAVLMQTASSQGVQLQPAAAEALIAIAGTDQMALQEELRKLITAAGEEKRITPERVEELATARTGDVFKLAERILDKDTPGALEILSGLRETPATRAMPFIIGGMWASFRRYLLSALEVERGLTPREAAANARVPPYFQREYARRLEPWSPRLLAALFDRMLQCDIQVKTGSVSEEVALETFVIDACSGNLEPKELVGRWLYEIEV